MSGLGIIFKRMKSSSSQAWRKSQWKDPYVSRARVENYRARSAYKLLEMDEKYKIIKPGDIVLDCGAAPGSWSQVAASKVRSGGNPSGRVIAVDLSLISPIEGVEIIHPGDITDPNVHKRIMDLLNGQKVDVVMSDMAPNFSGAPSLDHFKIISFAAPLLRICHLTLKPQGIFLMKILDGPKKAWLLEFCQNYFSTVRVVKPEASRCDSAENFLLCLGYLGLTNAKNSSGNRETQ